MHFDSPSCLAFVFYRHPDSLVLCYAKQAVPMHHLVNTGCCRRVEIVSPRVKPTGQWAKSGRIIVVDDGSDHGGTFHEFRDVPLGSLETVDVWIKPSVDALGRVAIRGIELSKPINARRLKSLPLDALRRESERLLHEEAEHVSTALLGWFRRSGGDLEGIADAPTSASSRLKALAITDRKSEDFLSLVADTVREARERGDAGWAAVSYATGVKRIQAQRYMAKARDAGFDMGTYKRTTDLMDPGTMQSELRKEER